MSAATRSSLRGAEIALGVLTLATVLGFSRLFDNGDFLAPLIVTVVVAHAVLAFARRRAWGLPLTAGAAGLGFVILSSWLFQWDTTLLGVPTPATISAARAELSDAWVLFQDVVAPAPTEPGFLLASCFAVWLAAYLADWAAFRLWSSFEAIVPAGTLFIFASLIGSDAGQITAAAIWFAAAVAFILVHRVVVQQSSAGWLGSGADGGGTSLAQRGALLGACSLVLAVAIGPALPGVDDPPLLSWRELNDGGGGSRVTISPMVDIRSRLVEQTDTEMFTVRSTEPSYWRLTSLDTFDGQHWTSKGDYDDADGVLPENVPAAVPQIDNAQEFQIEALAALWLPAAYEPRAVVSTDAEVIYEQESSTLIVGRDWSTSDGLRYEVTSELPEFELAELQAAPRASSESVARYTELPSDFSDEAVATAEEVTASAETPYDQAFALQTWFQENFRYSLDVQNGHGATAIDRFLVQRVGYCEQFSGTYAAMARSLGLPARVAVGFTPGAVDPDDPEQYHVTGENAHAWPEVYFEGLGWVPFEPTPDRRPPRSEQYTLLPPPTSEAETPEATATTSTTDPEASSTPGSAPELDAEAFAGDVRTEDTRGGGGDSGVLLWFAVTIVAVLLVAAGYVGAVTLAKRQRRLRRRRVWHGGETPPPPPRPHASVSGSTPRLRPTSEVLVDPAMLTPAEAELWERRLSILRGRALLAWAELLDELTLVGLRPFADETHAEFVARFPDGTVPDPSRLLELARMAAAALYSPYGPDERAVVDAEATVAEITMSVRARISRRTRVLALLDPRPLLPAGRVRIVTDRTAAQPRSI